MQVIQSPAPFSPSDKLLFLAGSIEMGVAELWQGRAISALAETDWTILNPRRDDWNPAWQPAMADPNFRRQVEWELDGLRAAQAALFYFVPGTRSPVTLMELGLMAARRDALTIVVCPEGFWRKGNVDILCHRFGLRQAGTLEQAIDLLR